MQLATARLCLDCEDVHDEPHCPVCGSEVFAYLSRWVPAPERRPQPRPTTSPTAEVYRRLITPATPAPVPPTKKDGRLLTGGVMGLTALGLAGWLWRAKKDRASTPTSLPRTTGSKADAPPGRS